MAEWVASIVTGVVGVAGIAGTYLAVFTQRKEREALHARGRAYEVQDALRQERKVAYIDFLDTADTILDLYLRAGFLERQSRDDGGREESALQELRTMWQRVLELSRNLQSATTKVELVAPENVRRYAQFFQGTVLGSELWAMEPRFKADGDIDNSIEAFNRISRRTIKARMDLIEVIRWDLTEVEEHLTSVSNFARRLGEMFPDFTPPDESEVIAEGRAEPTVPKQERTSM